MPTTVPLWDYLRETNVGSGEYRAAMEAYFASRGPAFPYKNLKQLVDSGGVLGRLKKRHMEDHAIGEMSYNADYIGRYKGRYVMRDYILALMQEWQLDVLVYPFETKPVRTIAEAVPDGGETPAPGGETGSRVAGGGNRISTVTGLPTMVVPTGFNTDGISVNLEILGRLYDEPTVIRIAYALEQAHPNRKLPASTPLLGIEKINY